MAGIEEAIYNRSERLLGADAMEVLATKRVIIFGVGGVGSWCAESLVRSGIKHLHYECKPTNYGHDENGGYGKGRSIEGTPVKY